MSCVLSFEEPPHLMLTYDKKGILMIYSNMELHNLIQVHVYHMQVYYIHNSGGSMDFSKGGSTLS
jgi:hypothetical protein